MNKTLTTIFYCLLVVCCVCLPNNAFAALSCTVSTSCADTTVMNLSDISNAHAEIPSLSNYTQKVCCSGLVGLSNSCGNTNAKTFAKLKNTTNSHAEIGTLSNYTNSLCISSASATDVFTIGYVATSSGTCTANGYDTAIVLLEENTNAHSYEPSGANVTTLNGLGIGVSVCGTVFSQSITFSISDNTIGFGPLTSGANRYATGDTLGSASTVVAHTLSVATNAAYGYSLNVLGSTLTSGIHTINAIGGTSALPAFGTEQFGLWVKAGGGLGDETAPYDVSGYFAYAASSTVPSEIGSAPSGNGATTTYSVRYIANITDTTEAGDYSTALTYVATANF